MNAIAEAEGIRPTEDLGRAYMLAKEYPGRLLSPGYILEIHDTATPLKKGWANGVRRTAARRTKEYPFSTDFEALVHVLCDKFNKDGDMDSFRKEFMELHPFRDGNGRTMRLVEFAVTKRLYLAPLGRPASP